MGYRSNIRIKLLKDDYNELVNKFEEKRHSIKKEVEKLKLLKENATLEEDKQEIEKQICKTDSMCDLFCKDSDYDDLIKKDKIETLYFRKEGQDEWESKEVEVVYFGWNGLKWYDGYTDVDFIMDFIRKKENYAYARIGEETDDMEQEGEGLDIYFYRSFEEDEE